MRRGILHLDIHVLRSSRDIPPTDLLTNRGRLDTRFLGQCCDPEPDQEQSGSLLTRGVARKQNKRRKIPCDELTALEWSVSAGDHFSALAEYSKLRQTWSN